MSANLRLYDRLVIAQLDSGHVLDIEGQEVLADVGRTTREQKQVMGDGTSWRESRKESLELPLLEDDYRELALQMDRQSCPCIAIALSHKHIGFFEPTTLHAKSRDSGAAQISPDVFSLETNNRHAAVSDARDLLAGIPWIGADVVLADTLEQIGSTGSDVTSSVDIASMGSGASNLVSVAEDDAVYEIINGGSALFTGVGGTNVGVAWDGTNLVVADSGGSDVIVVATDGTVQSTDTYAGNTPGSMSYDTSSDLLYVADSGGDVFVLDGTSNFGFVRQFTPDDGSNAEAVLVDGDDLYVRTADGSLEVWDLTVSPEELIGTYDSDQGAEAWDGLAKHDDVIFALTTGNASLQHMTRWKLRSPNQAYWNGPAWRIKDGFVVASDGTTTDLSTNYPAVLTLRFPLTTAVVQLDGATGTIEAFDIDGNSLGSVSGTDPQIDLSTGGDLSASDVWELRFEITSTTKRPELTIVDVGTPQGVRRGDASVDCVETGPSSFFLSDEDTDPTSAVAELSVEVIGSPSGGQVVRRFVPVDEYQLTRQGVAWAETAPSGAVTIDLTKNGSKVGEWTFESGGTFGSFTRTSLVSVTPTDVLRMVWPSDGKGIENVVLGVKMEVQ